MKLVKKTNNWLPSSPFFFDDFIGRDLSGWFDNNYSSYTTPAVNVKESDEGYQIELAVPGMSKNDFKIEFENDLLTVSSEKNESKENGSEKGNYYRKEFSYRSFERSFRVPENTINSEAIKASYQDGVLKVELPKKEELKPKPARLINVN